MMVSSSEVDVENVVIEIVCRETPIGGAHGQGGDLVRNIAVGIPVDDRHLVPLGRAVGVVACELSIQTIAFVHDAWVHHLHTCWRLEIYVTSPENCFKE